MKNFRSASLSLSFLSLFAIASCSNGKNETSSVSSARTISQDHLVGFVVGCRSRLANKEKLQTTLLFRNKGTVLTTSLQPKNLVVRVSFEWNSSFDSASYSLDVARFREELTDSSGTKEGTFTAWDDTQKARIDYKPVGSTGTVTFIGNEAPELECTNDPFVLSGWCGDLLRDADSKGVSYILSETSGIQACGKAYGE